MRRLADLVGLAGVTAPIWTVAYALHRTFISGSWETGRIELSVTTIGVPRCIAAAIVATAGAGLVAWANRTPRI